MPEIPTAVRRSALAGLTSLLLALAWPTSDDANTRAATATAVDLSGCHLAIVELLDDSERLGEFVSPPFTVAEFYGPGTAAVHLWHFACDGIAVDGRQPRPAQLTLTAVQIDPPDGPSWPTYVIRPDHEIMLYYLNTFDFYLHAAYSDHPHLTRALRRSGLPATYVQGMRFERHERIADPTGTLEDPLQLHTTMATVPSRHGPFGFTVQPSKQHPYHDHDNSWWFASDNKGEIRLRLRWSDAIDKWCSYHSPDCSTVWARGEVAELLGLAAGEADHREDGLGIDHDLIEQGKLTIAIKRTSMEWNSTR